MSNLFDKSEIGELIKDGYEYNIICEIYTQKYPNTRGLSVRNLRRFCKHHGINKNCTDVEKREVIVSNAVGMGGETYGRKMLTGLIKSEGNRISEVMVGKTLKKLNGPASSKRASATARNLNPKIYIADYFGQKLHVDQNEKLAMYGVTHICARDGHSGFIVAFVTMPVKNNLEIYEHIYRTSALTFGIWDTIRVDCGLEFVLMTHIQESLRHLRRDTSRSPVRRGKSTDNHVIERIWAEVNKRVNYPIKTILNTMVHNNLIDIGDSTTKFCVSWITCRVCAEGTQTFVNAWNSHYTSGKGTPKNLAKETNMCGTVSERDVPTTDNAVQFYLQSGPNRKLTTFSKFGEDPVLSESLKETRNQLFRSSFPDFGLIFRSILKKDDHLFTDALLYFKSLTVHYST